MNCEDHLYVALLYPISETVLLVVPLLIIIMRTTTILISRMCQDEENIDLRCLYRLGYRTIRGSPIYLRGCRIMTWKMTHLLLQNISLVNYLPAHPHLLHHPHLHYPLLIRMRKIPLLNPNPSSRTNNNNLKSRNLTPHCNSKKIKSNNSTMINKPMRRNYP